MVPQMTDDGDRGDHEGCDKDLRPFLSPDNRHGVAFQFPITHLILHVFNDLPDPGQQEGEESETA